MTEIRGPLGRVITPASVQRKARLVPDLVGPDALTTANARTVLHRCFVDTSGGDAQDADSHVRGWAVRTHLGQAGATALRTAVADRRRAALTALRRAGCEVRVVTLTTQTPLLTGTGDAGVRNVGIALHSTYGWPHLPGSAIKGVAHAYARDEDGMPLDQREAIFGAPRPGENGAEHAHDGAAVFLDALPLGEDAATVGEQVMTPHHRDYYEGKPTADGTRTPPAEYHNPVPVPFLVVNSGVFHTAIIVDHDHAAADPNAARDRAAAVADRAAELLKEAVDEIGLGAKTAAGFGYLTATAREVPDTSIDARPLALQPSVSTDSTPTRASPTSAVQAPMTPPATQGSITPRSGRPKPGPPTPGPPKPGPPRSGLRQAQA